jgi:hypothetical protein
MATDMGIRVLTEEQSRELQSLGNFNAKTLSWVKTPANIRKLGGVIFCDYRYDKIRVLTPDALIHRRNSEPDTRYGNT